MKSILFTFLAMLFFFQMGDASAAEPMDVPRVPLVTTGELKAKMDAGKVRLAIIDVRAKGEYETSEIQIKGAVSIPLPDISKRASEIPFGADIITYCS